MASTTCSAAACGSPNAMEMAEVGRRRGGARTEESAYEPVQTSALRRRRLRGVQCLSSAPPRHVARGGS
ncbi:MAG: hypothetical protein U5L46_12340 [Agrobacterium sp.]|nr:hypothetical protein [Agrobacterium sp.]